MGEISESRRVSRERESERGSDRRKRERSRSPRRERHRSREKDSSRRRERSRDRDRRDDDRSRRRDKEDRVKEDRVKPVMESRSEVTEVIDLTIDEVIDTDVVIIEKPITKSKFDVQPVDRNGRITRDEQQRLKDALNQRHYKLSAPTPKPKILTEEEVQAIKDAETKRLRRERLAQWKAQQKQTDIQPETPPIRK